jgi:hypothetical protein
MQTFKIALVNQFMHVSEKKVEMFNSIFDEDGQTCDYTVTQAKSW